VRLGVVAVSLVGSVLAPVPVVEAAEGSAVPRDEERELAPSEEYRPPLLDARAEPPPVSFPLAGEREVVLDGELSDASSVLR
jgi:hypothetical protein